MAGLLCGCRGAGWHTARSVPPGPVSAEQVTRSRDSAPLRKELARSEDPPAQSEEPIRLVSESRDTESPGDLDTASSLSLTECLSISLTQNPDLIALRQGDAVGRAALGVAQNYPFNPFVQFQATPYQDAPHSFNLPAKYHYVLLMQTLQLAHQQRYREESASFALNSVRWNIHQAELLNVAQTERLYFTALYQQGILELAEASHANNLQVQRTLQKQLEAGQATAADVAIINLDTRSTEQQLRLARANALSAVRDLQRQLGDTPESARRLSGDLRRMVWRLPSEPAETGSDASSTEEAKRLSVEWSRSRPDVMAAHADIDVARANRDLACAARTPDLQIGPYYQRTADGTYYLGFRGQMDIPVVNNGKPLVNQREAEQTQRVMTWNQIQRRAELEAVAAFERYELALSSVKDSEEKAESDLPQELQNLERQFLAGEVDIVRVVQGRTSLIQNQRARLDLLNELAQASANLTAATGIPPENYLVIRSP
ncbi:MAG: TolC family protein [Planctomycetales bacterium]